MVVPPVSIVSNWIPALNLELLCSANLEVFCCQCPWGLDHIFNTLFFVLIVWFCTCFIFSTVILKTLNLIEWHLWLLTALFAHCRMHLFKCVILDALGGSDSRFLQLCLFLVHGCVNLLLLLDISFLPSLLTLGMLSIPYYSQEISCSSPVYFIQVLTRNYPYSNHNLVA